MTLSRWRRIVTGVAAGVIVLCAALVGASFGGDNNGVSVAAENRPATTVIPIEEAVVPATDAIDEDTPATSEVASGLDPAVTGDAGDTGETAESTDPVQVIEPEDLPDDAAPDDAAAANGATGDTSADDSSTDGDADGTEATTGDTASTDAQAQTPALAMATNSPSWKVRCRPQRRWCCATRPVASAPPTRSRTGRSPTGRRRPSRSPR